MSSTATLPPDREKLFAYFEQQEQAKAEAKPNGRDAKGKFTPGNGGGPGNPFGRRVGELRKAMLAAVQEEDLQEILRALIEKAKEGHVPAAKLVLSYTVGKPTDAIDPDRKDIDEYRLEADKSVAARDLNAVLHSFPVDVAKAMLDIVWPCMLAKHGQTLNELHQESERTKREIEELDRALRADLELRQAQEAAAAQSASVAPEPPAAPATTTEPEPVPAMREESPSPNGVFQPNGLGQSEASDREPGRAGETPERRGDQPSPNGETRRTVVSEPGCAGSQPSPNGDFRATLVED